MNKPFWELGLNPITMQKESDRESKNEFEEIQRRKRYERYLKSLNKN